MMERQIMNSFTEILAEIEKFDTIIIHRHQSPDPDALGSQSGLAKALQNEYPEKTILMAGENSGNLTWIAEMDKVHSADYVGALVIVVDTANPPRIDDARYSQGAELIKIDHHPNDDVFGDLLYVNPEASSCSEIIADLINASVGKLRISKDVAHSLYAGIVGDTGRFLFNSTSAHTFDIGRQLVETGINHNRISLNLQEVTFKQAKLQNSAIDNLTLDESGAAYVLIDQAKLDELRVNQEQAKAIVGSPGRLKEIKAWVTFIQKPDGEYRVHYRSKGPIVNDLAKKHNGGGHPLASGADARNIQEVKDIFAELINATNEWLKETNE